VEKRGEAATSGERGEKPLDQSVERENQSVAREK
jgi:hypothetical protein